jgi:antirestriction protein ArdC
MEKQTVPFAALLNEAVNKPGVISEAYSRFYNYSFGNQLWAWSQCQSRNISLGPIATYKRWSELGRQVKKGEKAISLVVPVTVKDRDSAGNETGKVFSIFAVRSNWFVVNQTDGDDYQHEVQIPQWNKDKALETLGITEELFALPNGNVQGYAQLDTIAINPVAALPHKTRFHELAHVVLGHTKEGLVTDSQYTPRDISEVEAESVAYILCSLLDLPGQEESRGYIQSWLNGQTISDKSAQRIFATATKILDAGKV